MLSVIVKPFPEPAVAAVTWLDASALICATMANEMYSLRKASVAPSIARVADVVYAYGFNTDS